jgi:hypothetical protein
VLDKGVFGVFEGLSICVAIIIVAAITSVNGMIKERQFQEL